MAVTVEIGSTYGAWTVLEPLDYKQKYVCQCVCGTQQNVRVYDLIQGNSLMCRSCSLQSKASHGHTSAGKKTSTYGTWKHMIARCTNPSNKDYKNYGGRGITIYPVWLDSFEAFLLEMGEKPDNTYTIERVDVNKGYEPGNCKWIPRSEQPLNQRSNVRLTIDGETKLVTQWAQDPRCPVSCFTIYKRLNRGWEPERAVLEPSRKAK